MKNDRTSKIQNWFNALDFNEKIFDNSRFEPVGNNSRKLKNRRDW